MYKANFSISKTTIMKVYEPMLIKEFLDLRKEAVKVLNQYFEIWNGLYARVLNSNVRSEMERYGYSVSEMRKILRQINKKHRTIFVKLDCDKNGYIIGRCNDIVITMALEPVEKMKES